jgi:branched-chain amino acid transport system substrate-binding protein
MRLLSNAPFLASFLASSLCVLLPSAQAQELVVRIGHAGPLTGNIAHLGKDTENGVRMAIDEANTKGISIGGKKAKFVMQSEDDAAEPRQATLVAQKLVDGKVQGLTPRHITHTPLTSLQKYIQKFG